MAFMVNLKYDICNFTQLKLLIEGTACDFDPFCDKKNCESCENLLSNYYPGWAWKLMMSRDETSFTNISNTLCISNIDIKDILL